MIQGGESAAWRLDIVAQGTVQRSVQAPDDWAEKIAIAANWWGGPGVIWFAAVLWLGGRALGRATIARVGLRGTEGLAVASAISGIVKGLAGRTRPFVTPGEPWHWEFNHGWTDAQYFSMPSGHTTATFAFAVGIGIALRGMPSSRRAMIGAALAISAVLVAWARMYTGQHWFTDVLAGAILGTVTSVLLARWHSRRAAGAYDRVMLGGDAESSTSAT